LYLVCSYIDIHGEAAKALDCGPRGPRF